MIATCIGIGYERGHSATRYLYGYCITSNHVHIVLHCENALAVSEFMHLASGSTAKQYNLRKARTGSMWEKPYHCTIVEGGTHLLNCLCYVDLNMVRAGVVSRPGEWKWSSFDELTGTRKRYRILNKERLLQSMDLASIVEFEEMYEGAIERRLEKSVGREPHWTESLAVGSLDFVERTKSEYRNRWKFNLEEIEKDSTVWAVREAGEFYNVFSTAKNKPKA